MASRREGVFNISSVPEGIRKTSAEFAPRIKLGSLVEVYDGWRAQVVDFGEVVYIIEPDTQPPEAVHLNALLARSKDKAPAKPSKYRRLFLKRRNGFVKIVTANKDIYLLPGTHSK